MSNNAELTFHRPRIEDSSTAKAVGRTYTNSQK